MKNLITLALILCAGIFSACDVVAPAATLAPIVPTRSAGSTAFAPLAMPTTVIQTPLVIASPAPFVQTTPFPTPSTIVIAFAKTQAAQTYRVAMTLAVKQGNAPPFALDLKGETNDPDAHYAYQVGGESIEFTTTRGQFYAKGAKSMGLPTATKWYVITPDLADAVRPPFSPDDTLAEFVAQTSRLTFQSGARESFDGQNCQVWTQTPKSLAETGIGDALSADPEGGSFGTFDQAESKVWVCDDGMLHQIRVSLAAHNAKKTTDKGTATLLLHFWEMNNTAIKIDPPANAEPFRLGVPTP